MEFKVYVETNIVGSRVTGTIEVEEDASPEEIDREVREWMFENIEWGIL